ncbi:unnamed protein product [Penicillium nalgiovense]|nr:unnamed protein product [Penicillium nalgiovense]
MQPVRYWDPCLDHVEYRIELSLLPHYYIRKVSCSIITTGGFDVLKHRSASIALRPPVICHNSIRHAPNLARQQTKGLATTTAPSGLGSTIPPNYVAHVGQLKTFTLPEKATGSSGDDEMGKALINAWCEDGILQIAVNPKQEDLFNKAFAASKRFFAMSPNVKANCVDTQSYAGYIASREEITDGIADYSEIFTVTKDIPLQ